MGGTCRKEGKGHLLAIPDSSYYTINNFLEESGVEILGCRSEWMSLEELFIQTVKEQGK